MGGPALPGRRHQPARRGIRPGPRHDRWPAGLFGLSDQHHRHPGADAAQLERGVGDPCARPLVADLDYTGNVLWRLEYKIANIDGTFPAALTPLDVLDAGDGVADKHQMASFASIAMTGYTVSCMLLILLSRIGGDGTDTYTGTAKLNEFDIHYQVDSLGSVEEYTK